MGRTIRIALAVTFLSVALVACGGGGTRAPEPPAGQASALAPQTAPEPTPAPASAPQETPKPALPPEPAPAPAPARPEPKTAAKVVVADPGGPVAVAATVEGVTRIGADKCKMCHKTQYESWSGTGHAKRNPPLDCEACHGPGSGYKSIAVMKDAAQARAAGLVMPAKEFCATCHRSGWTDTMLAAVHAHKPK